MGAAAIVKFGTTSTTLLVAERLTQPLAREQRLINLMTAEGTERAVSWARALSVRTRDLKVLPLAAGGHAVRANPELESRLRQLFPRWWHLTASMEGRLAWIAVKAAVPVCDVVVDIGGGSTELVTQDHVWSIPVGAASGFDEVSWPDLAALQRPVFIGGTAVALQAWAGSPRLSRADVQTLGEQLQQEPGLFRQWDPLRRRILPMGLRILDSIMAAQGWSEGLASERGLTEGLWMAASLGRGGHP